MYIYIILSIQLNSFDMAGSAAVLYFAVAAVVAVAVNYYDLASYLRSFAKLNLKNS